MNILAQITAEPIILTYPLLSAVQVAKLACVDADTVRDWILCGILIPDPVTYGRKRISLKARKHGGRWKIALADLEAFIEAITSGSISPTCEPVGTAGGETTQAQKARIAACRKRLAEKIGTNPK